MRSNIGCICLTFPHCVLFNCIWSFTHVFWNVCENILTSKGRGTRSWSWYTLKSPLTLLIKLTLYKQILKNLGISFSQIPGSCWYLPTSRNVPGGAVKICMRDKKQRKGRKEATIVTLVRKDWFFLPQVHSKKTTSFQEIIILTHLFFLGY